MKLIEYKMNALKNEILIDSNMLLYIHLRCQFIFYNIKISKKFVLSNTLEISIFSKTSWKKFFSIFAIYLSYT